MYLIILCALYFGVFGIPKCIELTKFIRDYIRYNCMDKIKEIKKNRQDRNELSKTSIKLIKEMLISKKNIFPCSDSIQILHDDDYSNQYEMYMDILSGYTNYMNWGHENII